MKAPNEAIMKESSLSIRVSREEEQLRKARCAAQTAEQRQLCLGMVDSTRSHQSRERLRYSKDMIDSKQKRC